MFKNQSKESLIKEMQMTALELDRLMQRLPAIKKRLDAYTDDELTTEIAFSENEKNEIRSLAVSWANISLQYINATPLNGDNCSYINRQFLPAIRVF